MDSLSVPMVLVAPKGVVLGLILVELPYLGEEFVAEMHNEDHSLTEDVSSPARAVLVQAHRVIVAAYDVVE